MDIINRRDAAFSGKTKFFTGKQCIHGHLCERYVSTGSCIKCVTGYAKQYRKEFITTLASIPHGAVPLVGHECHPDDEATIRHFINYIGAQRRAQQPAALSPLAAIPHAPIQPPPAPEERVVMIADYPQIIDRKAPQ